jgi:hypothetical protein
MFPVRLKILVFYVTPRTPSSPRLIHFTEGCRNTGYYKRREAQSAEFTNIFSGKELLLIPVPIP